MSFLLAPGTKAPDFSLPGTDGKTYSLESFDNSPILVVAFTCNHCPYVVGSEDRILRLVEDYKSKGVGFVAINSNDAENYPDDGFDQMVERAKEKGFPYLHDETQETAAYFGAIKTPHFFVLDKDRVIRYTGRMDDNPKFESDATTHELRDALDDMLNNREVVVSTTEPVGCTIKWKGKGHKYIPLDVCDVVFKK